MATNNSSIGLTAGVGTNLASNIPTGLTAHHQVVQLADERGHIGVSAPTYQLFIPPSAAVANKVHCDLFNATGSGKTLRILSIVPVADKSVAITGTLGVNLFLSRSSTVGTGGTAATADGTSFTAATISKMNPADAALPAGVTARTQTGGGATVGALLNFISQFTEETNASSSEQYNLVPGWQYGKVITVPENSGIKITQGAIASAGSIAFLITFEAV